MERKKSPELGKLLGQKVVNVWLDREEKTNEIVSTIIDFERHQLILGVRNGKLIIGLTEHQ